MRFHMHILYESYFLSIAATSHCDSDSMYEKMYCEVNTCTPASRSFQSDFVIGLRSPMHYAL